jgi:hypothetical protein
MALITKEIVVSEQAGITRSHEFVRVGIPCAKGEFSSTDKFQLLAPDDETLPVQTSILKKWSDNSIKWLLVDFAATVPAEGRVVYRLVAQQEAAPVVVNPLILSYGTDHWRVSTGAADFVVDAKQFRPFKSIQINQRELLSLDSSSCTLCIDGRDLVPMIESITVEAEGPLRVVLRLEGCFDTGRLLSPRFVSRIHFFAGSTHVLLEFTLHNPQAAKHPGGLWDLGDNGSVLFKELTLQVGQTGSGDERIVCSLEPDTALYQFVQSSKGVRVYQESSGGDHWNSPVHRARDGSLQLRYCGYELSEGGEKIAEGKRATPIVWRGSGETGIAAVMPHFWQEFPKAFRVDSVGLKVELFPGSTQDLHELQGGEQKTTTMYLDFSVTPAGLSWARSPLVAAPSPETCRCSLVFNDLPPITGASSSSDLVDHFSSAQALLDKREVIDEYGWRNFGDVYADHEALYHKGDVSFVSHYNNQYDVISGAYRKYLSSGDLKWCDLAVDLAHHMFDIDIYHTSLDREEYNHGHFWHTDHYIDAGLSTHRSYSSEQLATKGITSGGGGPGAENCYTSGLLLHYWLTGNPDYRDAVIDMAEWVQIALTGPRTILAVVKKTVEYLKQLRSVSSEKCPLFPRYPLTRGTGNAITASLDAFEASGNRKYMNWVEAIILDSIHYADDIDARDLLNAELCWSYTVFLGALAKFIEKKIELNELDAAFEHAKASFLVYAQWMNKHEYPYLDKPEILEYPNETWAVQDVRKSVIFYYAARYADADWQDEFIERARYFYETAQKQLSSLATSSLTRPVALMLQNGWIGSKLHELKPLNIPSTARQQNVAGRPSPKLTLWSVVARVLTELSWAARATSMRQEVDWLRIRMSK